MISAPIREHGPSVVQGPPMNPWPAPAPQPQIQYLPERFHAKSTVEFSISILAVNGLEMTRQCIESVLSGGGDFELILTDNAGNDGIGKYFDQIQQWHRRTIVVHNECNKGFSDPSNWALGIADGRYFVTLNNDTVVPKGWLDVLKKPFGDFATAAISGPSGNCCVLRTNPVGDVIGDVGMDYEYVEGSCMCIPAKLARRFTLFSPYLTFAYGEDVDLSLRLRARGYTIHETPLTIVHHRAATSRSISFPQGVHAHNQNSLKQRWGGYIKTRRFDWPIIIRRKSALGDVLLTTPLLRAINQQQPRSQIHFETEVPQVLSNNPRAKVMKQGQFTYDLRMAPQLIDLDMSYENQPGTHIVDAYFKSAMIIPSEEDYRRTEIYIHPCDQATESAILTGKNWVAVHPGPSTWKGKDWGAEKFREVCRWLKELKYKVLLVGHGTDELPKTRDLRNQTSPSQLAAAIKRCRFFVGIDSFPLHIAESVGVPVIGLFGVTDPRYIMTGDRSLSIMGTAACAGERHRVAAATHVDCDGSCINSISVEQVLERVNSI